MKRKNPEWIDFMAYALDHLPPRRSDPQWNYEHRVMPTLDKKWWKRQVHNWRRLCYSM